MLPENIEDKKSLSLYRFERATQSLETAIKAKDNDDWYATNNRTYYAIFHAIRSVLALDNIDYKKHSNVIGYFNKYYIATSIFDKNFAKLINSAFEIRQKSDYEDFYIINKKNTEKLLLETSNFLKEIKIYLHSKSVL